MAITCGYHLWLAPFAFLVFLTVEDVSTLGARNKINELAKQYEQVHVERRNKGECAVDASVIFIEMLWELERIGDHLVNIAQRAPEMQKFYINI